MAGTTGLEPATSDVTGARASPLFTGKYAFLQWVTDDTGRHGPTRNDPFSQLLLTHLLTQLKSARTGGLPGETAQGRYSSEVPLAGAFAATGDRQTGSGLQPQQTSDVCVFMMHWGTTGAIGMVSGAVLLWQN